MIHDDSEGRDVRIAVALIANAERRILWTWNDGWGVFALPMTRRREGEGVVELPAHAAARAAAEALGVPVRIGAHWTAIPEQRVSGRDFAVRTYAFDVFRAEPHPRYATALQIRQPHLWLTPHEALSGEFRPLSHPCLEIVTKAVIGGQLPGRIQHTSTLIVRRGDAGERRFLLRWNEHWGFTLPMKRRAPEESAARVAERVAIEELGLSPGRDVEIVPARVETLTMRGPSPSETIPTYYRHALFDATLAPQPNLVSAEPLVWASREEIVRGTLDAPGPAPESGAPRSPAISRTAFQVLAAADEVPWVDTSLTLHDAFEDNF